MYKEIYYLLCHLRKIFNEDMQHSNERNRRKLKERKYAKKNDEL
jgi:hypothetical protein